VINKQVACAAIRHHGGELLRSGRGRQWRGASPCYDCGEIHERIANRSGAQNRYGLSLLQPLSLQLGRDLIDQCGGLCPSEFFFAIIQGNTIRLTRGVGVNQPR